MDPTIEGNHLINVIDAYCVTVNGTFLHEKSARLVAMDYKRAACFKAFGDNSKKKTHASPTLDYPVLDH